jgi:hypothetical protein
MQLWQQLLCIFCSCASPEVGLGYNVWGSEGCFGPGLGTMEMWRAVVCATSGFAFRGVWHQGSFEVGDGHRMAGGISGQTGVWLEVMPKISLFVQCKIVVSCIYCSRKCVLPETRSGGPLLFVCHSIRFRDLTLSSNCPMYTAVHLGPGHVQQKGGCRITDCQLLVPCCMQSGPKTSPPAPPPAFGYSDPTV